MVTMTIERKCGHKEKIGVMGFSGVLESIPLKYRREVEKNIQWQRDKLCLPCFEALPNEEKQKLLKEIENGTG